MAHSIRRFHGTISGDRRRGICWLELGACFARGDEVVVLDNFSTGRRENLADVVDRIKLIEGSLADREAVEAAVDGVDGVLHQGLYPRSLNLFRCL